ncbi:MAG: serine hydrolase domain-containing protein, partial [Planctomycetota bacterium]|nr:serine hydrolase domain-containing protein [Planctomycetota bacterium]
MRTPAYPLGLLTAIACLGAPGRAQSGLFPAAHILDQAVQESVVPGGILYVGQGGNHDRVKPFLHVSGALAVAPEPEALSPDAIFDLASLTKPVATATAIMILVDRGRVVLDAPVTEYLPAFGAAGKSGVTVEHLLLHRSGLTADNPLGDYFAGREEA